MLKGVTPGLMRAWRCGAQGARRRRWCAAAVVALLRATGAHAVGPPERASTSLAGVAGSRWLAAAPDRALAGSGAQADPAEGLPSGRGLSGDDRDDEAEAEDVEEKAAEEEREEEAEEEGAAGEGDNGEQRPGPKAAGARAGAEEPAAQHTTDKAKTQLKALEPEAEAEPKTKAKPEAEAEPTAAAKPRKKERPAKMRGGKDPQEVQRATRTCGQLRRPRWSPPSAPVLAGAMGGAMGASATVCSAGRTLFAAVQLTRARTLTLVTYTQTKARMHARLMHARPHTRTNARMPNRAAGACKAEAALFCPDVEGGEGALADCIGETMQGIDDDAAEAAKQARSEDDDEVLDEAEARVSEPCRDAVLQFRIDRSSNINKNIPLGAPRGAVRWRWGLAARVGWLAGASGLWPGLGVCTAGASGSPCSRAAPRPVLCSEHGQGGKPATAGTQQRSRWAVRHEAKCPGLALGHSTGCNPSPRNRTHASM